MKARFSSYLLIVSALLGLLLTASCVGLDTAKKLKVSSCKLARVQMPSFESRSVTVTLLAKIDNPATYLRLSEISGEIHTKDTPLAYFAFKDISIEGKTNKEYALELTLTPAPDISIMRLLDLVRTRSFKDCVFDIDFRMSSHPSAKGVRYQLKNQAVEKLLP